jgi:hypothetical protein
VPQLAAILHSYAKLQLLPGTVEFMAQLVGRLKGRISSGAGVDGKVLAMLGWSLARLGCTNETVLAGEGGGAGAGARRAWWREVGDALRIAPRPCVCSHPRRLGRPRVADVRPAPAALRPDKS